MNVFPIKTKACINIASPVFDKCRDVFLFFSQENVNVFTLTNKPTYYLMLKHEAERTFSCLVFAILSSFHFALEAHCCHMTTIVAEHKHYSIKQKWFN